MFVQGESSAAGFPYGLGASLAGMLDQRLERAFPSREIEVVSTAMAAVTTYALVDFADEIIAQQPDAVVVYVGHNEYLGILGVGSTMRMSSRPWLTRAFLEARELRLFQLLSRLYSGFATQAPGNDGGPGESLMATVAGERSIAFDSPLYRAGLAQFESNLDALLRRYERAGIPVFIGTLASNERDQAPLAILAGWKRKRRARPGPFSSLRRTPRPPAISRRRREGYAWARDLDPLRFRAPAPFNAVVDQRGSAARREGRRGTRWVRRCEPERPRRREPDARARAPEPRRLLPAGRCLLRCDARRRTAGAARGDRDRRRSTARGAGQ